MRFVFIRHGQPEWFRDGAAVDDPGLTAVGHTQAQLVAERLAAVEVAPDIVLVSSMRRAQETAAPIARALGIDPIVSDWLCEIGSPQWNGAPLDYVQEIFEAHRDKPVDDHWEGLEGGESFRDFHVRVTAGLQEFLDRYGKTRVHHQPALFAPADDEPVVVVVAHGGTNASAIGHLLGLEPVPWEWERFVTFHASVSVVEPIAVSKRHAYSLLQLSDVSHLPPGLRTR